MISLSKDSDGDDEDRPVDDAVGEFADGAEELHAGELNVDELNADELDEPAPREAVAVGANAGPRAGSARAAARASAVRSGVTPGKGRATPSRNRGESRGNLFQRIARFLREVASELRKVIWPTRNEMVTYSIVVILFLIFMIAVTWGADFGFSRLVLWIFG